MNLETSHQQSAPAKKKTSSGLKPKTLDDLARGFGMKLRPKFTAYDRRIAELSARLRAVETLAVALQQQLKSLEARPVGAVDAGLHEPGKTYSVGQGVTFDGGFLVAQQRTSESPGEGSSDWRLCVRRGKQGRNCPNCPRGAASS